MQREDLRGAADSISEKLIPATHWSMETGAEQELVGTGAREGATGFAFAR